MIRATLAIWRVALLGCLVLSFGGCIEWQQTVTSSRPTIANYISTVETVPGATSQISAALRVGTPNTTLPAPVVTAQIPALILLGGTVQVTATSATPFTKIAVVIPDLEDYWELTLPAPVTSQDLLIVFGQNVPTPVFQMRLAGSAGANYGVAQISNISMISVGTGDVQVNITWDSRADVDLHVLDPFGEEVYWAHRTAVSGGQLDLDSNAACGTDGPRAENIFWATGLIAPHGDYVVRADYWSNCQDVKTNYVVTINARGHPPSVYTGSFVGSGDSGGKGSGKIITTFTY